MTSFYILLEVAVLLAAIILPLTGPKPTQATRRTVTRTLAVNENGLSYIYDTAATPGGL